MVSFYRFIVHSTELSDLENRELSDLTDNSRFLGKEPGERKRGGENDGERGERDPSES